MLSYIPEISATMRGVGSLVGEQRPFVGFLMKNWPLAALAGVALFARLRERHKKGELGLYNGMADFGLIISPLVGLALLNQLAREEQQITLAQQQQPMNGMAYLPQQGYDFHPAMLANQPFDAPQQAPQPQQQVVGATAAPLAGVHVVNPAGPGGQGESSHLSGGMWG